MRRDALGRSWACATAGALALLILTGSVCCLEHDGPDPTDMDHHVVPMGFCAAIVVSPPGLPLGGLPLLGMLRNRQRDAFAQVSLSVPKPPPRLARSS